MIRNIVHGICTFIFIIGGVSLGLKAVHPTWAYVAIFVIIYAGLMGPKLIKAQEHADAQALLFGYFVGLPLIAARWLLTH